MYRVDFNLLFHLVSDRTRIKALVESFFFKFNCILYVHQKRLRFVILLFSLFWQWSSHLFSFLMSLRTCQTAGMWYSSDVAYKMIPENKFCICYCLIVFINKDFKTMHMFVYLCILFHAITFWISTQKTLDFDYADVLIGWCSGE